MASDGEEAFERLVVERLDGEDEEKDKLVYLCLYSRPLNYVEGKTPSFSFFKFDAANTDRVDDVMVYNNKTFPPDLLTLVNFGCTAWNSKIYIVGGFRNGSLKDYPSQKVFIYDTLSHEWKTSVMNLQRGSKPMVVAADDKIFVFGGCHKDLDIKVWSEFCDIADDTTSEWHYLPNPAPEYLKSHPPRTHAVHQRGKKILFWCDAPRMRQDGYKDHELFSWIHKGNNNMLFYYNYHVKIWHQYDFTSKFYMMPLWTPKVAVIEDFIFWHYNRSILVKDLAGDVNYIPYDVPMPSNLDREQIFFLVHLGKNRLGLFCCAYGSRVWYHTILVRISHIIGSPRLHFVPDCTGYFDARYPCILHALEIPS